MKNSLKWRKIFFSTVFLLTLVLFSADFIAQDMQFANQLRLAKTYESRGELDQAEKIYYELYQQQPINNQFYSSLLSVLIAQKKYDESLNLVQNQLRISSNKVGLYGDLGSVYYHLGNEKKAEESWEKGLELEPDNPFAYRTIANYLIENRLLDNAVEVLKRGNDVSDDKTIFSYDIANFYSITMKFEEATREYCTILASKPKQINLIKNRIFGYVNSNQATEPTLQIVEEYYEEEESQVFLQLLAELYVKTEKYQEALNAVIELDQLSSRNGSEIFIFAQNSYRDSNFEFAARAYRYIIDNFPSSALFSESEIGYTKSLEQDLTRKTLLRWEWKPFNIESGINLFDYEKLVKNYENLALKYTGNKIGLEAEYRIGLIYQDHLNNLKIADSIFNKILDESKSLQYIEDVKFRLARLFIEKGDLTQTENYLSEILSSQRTNEELKSKAQFFQAKTSMWKGEFSKSISEFGKVIGEPGGEFVNDALQYSLILNTFKKDSVNLFYFVNADYLVEKKDYLEALNKFNILATNENLFILKDFASVRYAELLLALNNYTEAGIFLEEISNCDVDNVYKDRYLYLLGSNYYYGLNNAEKAKIALTRIFNECPNSIYYNKAVKIISRINERLENTL